MAAQLTQIPPVIAFSRNAMPVELTTDNITPDRAHVDLNLTGFDGPLVGQTLTITMGLKIWTFTFVQTPDNSGWQLPIQGTHPTIQQWWAIVADRFRMNPDVSELFLVVEVYPNIRLRYRESGPLSIAAAGNLSDVIVTAHAVTRVVNVPNLSAYITVHDAQTHETLLALTGAYSVENRKCTFDIRAAFADVRPSLPTEVAPNPSGVFSSAGEQRAIHAYRHYYIRYADRYGTPPKPEIMHKSPSVMTVIQGGTTSGSVDFFNRPIVPLHNYFSHYLGMPFVKSVTMEQPDWLYFVSPVDRQGLKLEYLVKYSDGSERLVPSNSFNAVAGQVQLVATGFKQVGLHLILPPVHAAPSSAFPVGYEFRIRLADNSMAIRLVYELELFAAWNTYILLDNGVGGLESIRLKGKKTRTYEAESVIFEKNDGKLSAAFAEGFSRYEASTGWYEAYQTEHLAQLLLGQLWLIEFTDDPQNPRFVPIVAEKQSFTYQMDDTDEGMQALTFKYRIAQSDSQSNRF